jgi:hypothetical protein
MVMAVPTARRSVFDRSANPFLRGVLFLVPELADAVATGTRPSATQPKAPAAINVSAAMNPNMNCLTRFYPNQSQQIDSGLR